MPSMISLRRSGGIENLSLNTLKAFVTGCCGFPANRFATSRRHQASLVAASWGSAVSSTTSSTSRQKAYSAGRAGGRPQQRAAPEPVVSGVFDLAQDFQPALDRGADLQADAAAQIAPERSAREHQAPRPFDLVAHQG